MASFVLLKHPAPASCATLDSFIKPHASFYQWYDIPSYGQQKLLVWSLERQETSCYYQKVGVGFIAVAGTLLYKGTDGETAAAQFLEDFDPHNPGAVKAYGHYALCIEKSGALMVLNDALGAWKLYRHAEGHIVSAGFLETLLLDTKPQFCQQGLYEYVFNGHALGENTLLQSVKAMMPGYGCTVDQGGQMKKVRHSSMPCSGLSSARGATLEAEANAQLESLQQVFAAYSSLIGGVSSSLSGGFDSRLMLAMFLAHGVTPDVFVYGAQDDPDVVSAQQVARKAGLPIRHIDKRGIDGEAASVDRLLLYFDGWPEDGFEGAQTDLHDRLERSAVAPYMANGSGGEVYRHFFLYPNKPVSRDAFVRATYGRVDRGIVSSVFNYQQYHASVSESFDALMGGSADTLDREAVDRVYINVRITHEKARDIVINHRFHKVLYPFMEYDVAHQTVGINFKYRQYGALEAKMNALINPTLAAIPGEYGFNFIEGADLSYKRRMFASYQRPLWLRRLIPALRRLGTKPQGAAALTKDMAALLPDTGFPYMRRYFAVDRVSDPITASRIASLEMLAQRFGIEI